ncbi:hypothetical protein UFOVP652_17 [uncultured Caudovirales phage]|jgi:hypothetical protein|uniref:Uncharacterized protein n=1 Tax=uncultured Caudovirales phage TaxID=2100421 RepID=A0A6J5N517_9CAUD|nr:hypothetical protein UFOVP652_17 [uncultured Caudovirales phage]CAB5224033.1 hypothetical protein UFOVP734_22 [uncultured Caudovirales phage]
MSHVTESTCHTAIKRHRCTWCWQFIEAGEQYQRYRYYDGGEASTIKMHPECFDAMQQESRELGYGVFEWTPGQERPERKAQ